jgi:predicted amidohydrolase
MMKVALVQMDSREDKARNVMKALDFVRRAFAKKAKFVLLPEYFYFIGKMPGAEDLRKIVEPVGGPTTEVFAALAKQFRGYVLLGSIYERIPGQNKAYNTSVLIGSSGKVLATYRKRNLFSIRFPEKEIREGNVFKPGKTLKVVSVGEFKLGMSVCFDVRFPGLYHASARLGANVFSIPSAFTRTTGKPHWEVLLRARAIETLSYVLAPDQTGLKAEGVSCWGQSMIVDPWGQIIGQASQNNEEIVYGDIDLSTIKKTRAIFPNYKCFKQ